MPRQPRIDLPHIPQHVLQRGNDRRTCFFQPIDQVRYLDELRDITRRIGCAVHAYGARDPLLEPHPAYIALGSDAENRQQAYRVLLAETLTTEDLELIRLRLQRQHTLGSDRFRAVIEAQLARRAGPTKIGRPRKNEASASGA